MQKIGIVDYAYERFGSFEEKIKNIARHGYGYIDYSYITDTDSAFFKRDDTVFYKDIEKHRLICESYGIKVAQAHGPWRYPPLDNSEELRKTRFVEMSKAIKATALLGCENIVIHGLMPFTTHDVGFEEETEKINLDFFQKLAKIAEEQGVYICLENMPMLKYTLNTPKRILDFIKRVDSKNLKVCLDTGHCNVFDSSPAKAVRMIGKDLLKALHIHDNDGKSDKHLNPFHGTIDWLDFSSALKEIGYDGVMCLETSIPNSIPHELLEDELLSLKKKIEFLALKASR